MTYAAEIFRPGDWLGQRIEAALKSSAEHRARRRAYNRTISELQAMSDRDLADIGISRLSIEDCARATVYGDQS